MKRKLIEVSGTLRAPAYIGNIYYMGGEKINSMKILVSAKGSHGAEVVELSEESLKLVEETMNSLKSPAKAAPVKVEAPIKVAPAKVAPAKVAPAKASKPAEKSLV